MLEYRYLPAFFAVAEKGNFTAAGKALRIATSAISRQIQLLEDACGTQLFFRSAREATLTEIGQKLYVELKHFQSSADGVLQNKSTGQFRIGVLEGVLHNWFLNLLESPQFPKHANLEFKVAHPGELITLVEQGQIDATFLSLPQSTRIPSSLKTYRIYKEEIVLISAEKTSIQEIDTLPWICYSRDSYIMRYSKKTSKKVIVVNNMSAVVEMVSRGLGVSMVPSHVIQDRKNLHAYPVSKFSKEYIYLVTRKYQRAPLALAHFTSFIKKHAKDWKEIESF
jgi:DNA-binding transcriptional LysR family regulator